MTLNRLHKLLGRLIDEGYGHRSVCVAKSSFVDNRESDGCTILDVHHVDTQWVVNADDDGGTKFNKDGTESGAVRVILGGCAYEMPKRGAS